MFVSVGYFFERRHFLNFYYDILFLTVEVELTTSHLIISHELNSEIVVFDDLPCLIFSHFLEVDAIDEVCPSLNHTLVYHLLEWFVFACGADVE